MGVRLYFLDIGNTILKNSFDSDLDQGSKIQKEKMIFYKKIIYTQKVSNL